MSIRRTMAVASAIAVSAYITPPRAAAQSPPYATHGDATLAALIGEALEGNPRVRAALLESRAAESRTEQAATLPDPALSFTQHVLGPQTRVGPQFSNVSVTQSLPWFGTLADRRRDRRVFVGPAERVVPRTARRSGPPGQAGLLRPRVPR